MKKLVNESLITESSKRDLYDRLVDWFNVEERIAIALCNYFSTAELEGFIEFLENESK